MMENSSAENSPLENTNLLGLRVQGLFKTIGDKENVNVKIGKPGGGDYWDPEKITVNLDPNDLLRHETEWMGISAHEAMHARISRWDFIPEKTLLHSGFQQTIQTVEDIRVYKATEKMYEGAAVWLRKAVRSETAENGRMNLEKAAKEYELSHGYIPYSFWYCIELQKRFVGGIENDTGVPAPVLKTLNRTKKYIEEIIDDLPESEDTEEKILISAKNSYEIIKYKIWPEFEKLRQRDIENYMLRDMFLQAVSPAGKGIKELFTYVLDEDEKKEVEGLMSIAEKEYKKVIAAEHHFLQLDSISPALRLKLLDIKREQDRIERKKTEEFIKNLLEILEDKTVKSLREQLADPEKSPTHEEDRKNPKSEKDKGKDELLPITIKMDLDEKDEEKGLARGEKSKAEDLSSSDANTPEDKDNETDAGSAGSKTERSNENNSKQDLEGASENPDNAKEENQPSTKSKSQENDQTKNKKKDPDGREEDAVGNANSDEKDGTISDAKKTENKNKEKTDQVGPNASNTDFEAQEDKESESNERNNENQENVHRNEEEENGEQEYEYKTSESDKEEKDSIIGKEVLEEEDLPTFRHAEELVPDEENDEDEEEDEIDEEFKEEKPPPFTIIKSYLNQKEEVDPINLETYKSYVNEVKPLIDTVYEDLDEVLAPNKFPRWKKGFPTGNRISLSEAMQFEADKKHYNRLMERKTIPQRRDFRFSLLVDLSGSMQWGKDEEALKTTILFAEVLDRLGIDFEILGFNTMSMSEDVLEQYVYKRYGETYNDKNKSKLARMLIAVGSIKAQYNDDGPALLWASKRLEENEGKDNFLLVISDGQPAPSPSFNSPQWNLRNAVSEVMKKPKQCLVGLGIGRAGVNSVKRYYPNNRIVPDVNTLSVKIRDLLEDMITYPEKYRK